MAMQPGKMPLPAEAEAPAPAQEGQPQGAPQGGSAQDIVVGINDLMDQLMAKMQGKSDPENMEQLAAAQQAFQAFVDAMGAPQGGAKGGVGPVEAGAAKVKPMM